MSRFFLPIARRALGAIGAFLLSGGVLAANISVTSDAGTLTPGNGGLLPHPKVTLADAVAQANRTAGNVTIQFALPVGTMIRLAVPVVVTAPRVTINGAVGNKTVPQITVVGVPGQDAITLSANGDVVENLAISSIGVRGPSDRPLSFPVNGVLISHCLIGLDAISGIGLNAHRDGVAVIDAVGTLIFNNVIGGNQALVGGIDDNLAGVKVYGGSRAIISGNRIGIDRNGNQVPNDIGILIQRSSGNLVGGQQGGVPCTGQCNLIDGNVTNGIIIDGPGSSGNTISGNFVGVAPDGRTAIPNGLARGLHNAPAIAIGAGAANTTIGGTSTGKCVGKCNLISGNIAAGVMVKGAVLPQTVIAGNFIGVTADGQHALPNQSKGVDIELGATDVLVGGTRTGTVCDGPCNVISGNGDDGVYFTDANTSGTVSGNFIGTDLTGETALPNQGFGVRMDPGAVKVQVGGLRDTTCEHECNLISGNASSGVGIVGAGGNSVNATISGNAIGTDVKESSAVPNGVNGVSVLSGATDIMIGGDAMPGPCSGVCNNIAYNGNKGVVVAGLSNRVSITGNTIHGNSALDIDLDDDGVSPNIAPTATASPARSNNGVGFPMGVTAFFDGTNTVVSGLVDAVHPESYRVDVYAGLHARCGQLNSPTCFGSPELYLGKAGVTQSGSFRLVVPGELPLKIVSATSTDPTGATSEVSPACSDRLTNDGVTDQDGDGLCDDWERFGIDINGDGVLDNSFTDNAGKSASPTIPDDFVEVDYAPSALSSSILDTFDVNSALGYARLAFKNGLAVNSHVSPGVQLHFLGSGPSTVAGFPNIDEILPSRSDSILVGGLTTPLETDTSFAALRTGDKNGVGDPCAAPTAATYGSVADRVADNCHFILLAKRLFVHYVLIAPSFGIRNPSGNIYMETSSGSQNSFQDTFIAYDIIKTESHGSDARLLELLVGTFMHEFGHLHRLCHGGPAPIGIYSCPQASDTEQYNLNYKPNFVSVMNYAYQGFFDNTSSVLTYSRSALVTLNEASLSEANGLPISAGTDGDWLRQLLQGVRFFTATRTSSRDMVSAPFGPNIDWNNNNIPNEVDELNIHDPTLGSSTPLRSLSSAVDWPSLHINFRDAPDFNASILPVGFSPTPELGASEVDAIRSTSDLDRDGVADAVDNCPLTSNPNQAATTGRTAGDACAIAPATFAPLSMVGGTTATIVIRTVSPTGALGSTYHLRTDLAGFPLPEAVTIPPGNTSVGFSIAVPQVPSTVQGTIDVLGDEDFGRIPVTIALNLSFAVTDLGTLGGAYSSAYGINDAGSIVGTSYIATDNVNSRPFVWSTGIMQELPSIASQPGGAALAINEYGRIVGSVGNTTSAASRWDGNVLTQLPSLVPGGPAQAVAINAAGNAAGAADAFSVASVTHATLWTGTILTDLGTMGGTSSSASNAAAINDSGTIAGTTDDTDGQTSAFQYLGGKMTALPRPAGTDHCTGGAIDSGGIIYGRCWALGQTAHLVKWSGGVSFDLGPIFDATSAEVHGANAAGQVVGVASGSTGQVPFLFSFGKVFDLNTLLPAGTQWHLDMALGINAKGMIVGQGENAAGQTHAFLLTPQ